MFQNYQGNILNSGKFTR